MGRLRYVIEARKETRRKNIPIGEEVHLLLKTYAKEHDITLLEATYRLIGKGFEAELKEMKEGIDKK